MNEYSENKEYEDLEDAVLGAIILEGWALDEVSEDLKPHCFLKEANQHVFRAILELKDEKIKPDILTVSQKIRSKGLLDSVGGSGYVPSLTNRVAGSSHIESHARIIIGGYLIRKMAKISSAVLIKINDRDVDPFDLYEYFKNEIDQTFNEVTGNRSFDTILSKGDEFLKEVNDKKEGLIEPGIPLGLNVMIPYGGNNNSDLIYWGARPGMGKTAMLIRQARHSAIVLKKPTGIFSIEMKSLQLITRVAASDCQIDSEYLRTGNVSDQQINQLHARINELKKAPLYIDDRSRELSVIISQSRKMVMKHSVKQIFIDYLGLVRVKGIKDEYSLLNHVSSEFKNLAKELDIPIIVFFQLNRDIEKRLIHKRFPLMSDARGSGAIEQDADQMFVLFRPEYYGDCPHEETMDGTRYYIEDGSGGRIDVTGKCYIGCVKNRHGKIGTELVGFRSKYTEFHDLYEPLPDVELSLVKTNNDFLNQYN